MRVMIGSNSHLFQSGSYDWLWPVVTPIIGSESYDPMLYQLLLFSLIVNIFGFKQNRFFSIFQLQNDPNPPLVSFQNDKKKLMSPSCEDSNLVNHYPISSSILLVHPKSSTYISNSMIYPPPLPCPVIHIFTHTKHVFAGNNWPANYSICSYSVIHSSAMRTPKSTWYIRQWDSTKLYNDTIYYNMYILYMIFIYVHVCSWREIKNERSKEHNKHNSNIEHKKKKRRKKNGKAAMNWTRK